MADVTIKYKGANIATMDASGTKTLETSGKYCEGDVQVVYADPEKPTQSKTVTPTASGFTVSPDSGKVLSSVVVNGDADLIASNIRSGKNIFGVDGTLVEGITPSGNKAITATTSTQTGIDVTDYATVSVAPTPSETKSVTTNGDVTPTSGKLLSKVTVNVPTGTARSASDLTVSGATVTVPAGLYSAQATKSVASGSAGTPSASKGTVSNNSVTVTPSVTNTTGYITGGTKTGTGVTVSASELVSGNKALTPSTTAQTNIDVKNYATASVAAITKELLASLDADFVADNIKKDVDLFGLLGTLEGGGGDYDMSSFIDSISGAVSFSFTPTSTGGATYVYLPANTNIARVGLVYTESTTYSSKKSVGCLWVYTTPDDPRNSVTGGFNMQAHFYTASSTSIAVRTTFNQLLSDSSTSGCVQQPKNNSRAMVKSQSLTNNEAKFYAGVTYRGVILYE